MVVGERLICCEVGCAAPAEWEVWDGVEPYFDRYWHACTPHLGVSMSDAREHRVYPIQVAA